MEEVEFNLKNFQDEYTRISDNVDKTTAWVRENALTFLDGVSKFHLMKSKTYFNHYCMYDRIHFSARDAMYGFQFIKLMQIERMHFFPTLAIIHDLVSEVLLSMVCSTEFESHYMGIFFDLLFKQL